MYSILVGGVSISFGGSLFFWEGCPFHLGGGVVFYCKRGGRFLFGGDLFLGCSNFNMGVLFMGALVCFDGGIIFYGGGRGVFEGGTHCIWRDGSFVSVVQYGVYVDRSMPATPPRYTEVKGHVISHCHVMKVEGHDTVL